MTMEGSKRDQDGSPSFSLFVLYSYCFTRIIDIFKNYTNDKLVVYKSTYYNHNRYSVSVSHSFLHFVHIQFFLLLTYNFFRGRHHCSNRDNGCVSWDFTFFVIFFDAIGKRLFPFYDAWGHRDILNENKKMDEWTSNYKKAKPLTHK